MWRRCPRSHGAAPRGSRVPPSDSRTAPRAGGSRRIGASSEAHQGELVHEGRDARVRRQLFPEPAVLRFHVVEMRAQAGGILVERRRAQVLDGGARLGRGPVAQARAEVVEGGSDALFVRASSMETSEGPDSGPM